MPYHLPYPRPQTILRAALTLSECQRHILPHLLGLNTISNLLRKQGWQPVDSYALPAWQHSEEDFLIFTARSRKERALLRMCHQRWKTHGAEQRRQEFAVLDCAGFSCLLAMSAPDYLATLDPFWEEVREELDSPHVGGVMIDGVPHYARSSVPLNLTALHLPITQRL